MNRRRQIWGTLQHAATRLVHVYPVNDLKRHQLRRDGVCWCTPTRAAYAAGTLIAHRSLDGRELIEQHGLQ